MNENLYPITETTFYILCSLAESKRHGYSIIKEVERLSEGRIEIATGTLYSALKRLLDYGWIERCEPPEEEPADLRDRKYYRLTDKGKQVFKTELVRIKTLNIMINKFKLGEDL
jgi:DNA-binding PadR family transcriptional regulator